MKLNSQVPIEERWKADAGFSILPPEENADGGPGSGNFGHGGRPGKIGGSAPSDESSGSTGGQATAKSTEQKFKSMIEGEVVHVKNLGYGYETTLEKRRESDSWTDLSTGEIVYNDDLLDPKKFSIGKTEKEIHDEKYDLSPRFKTKEEYQKAKEDAIASSRDILDEIDRGYQKDRKEIEDKYGDRFELRSKVLNDSSLSDEEREQKLKDIDFSFEKKNRELSELLSDYDEIKEPYLDKSNAVFEPEYEYKKIESAHTVDDDCDRDVVNPGCLKTNCQRCSIAFELRQRGYDVQASNGEGDDLGKQGNVNACFLNPDIYVMREPPSNDATDDVVAKMKEWGNYSRAVLCLSYADEEYGHAANLCNIEGEVYYVDSQSGVRRVVDDYNRIEDVDYAYIIRTDNARLSANAAKYVKERAE